MKNFKTLFCITAAAFAAELCAVAGTGTLDFGITNATFTGSATFTATGATNAVDIKNQDNCSLVFKGTVITTNAAPTATLTFARVDGDGNVESGPRFTWAFGLATGGDAGVLVTNNLVQWTNFPQSTIGAATGLKLISVVTANMTGPGTITNSPSLKEQVKTVKAQN